MGRAWNKIGESEGLADVDLGVMTVDASWAGWWRIVESEISDRSALKSLEPALLPLTGEDDRLRMGAIVAHVHPWPTKAGVSFTWEGSEFGPISGSGTPSLGWDGKLRGKIRIKDGDAGTFVAERTEEPDEPIRVLPSYRDKWR